MGQGFSDSRPFVETWSVGLGLDLSAFEFFKIWFSERNHFRRFDVQNIVVVLTKHVAPSHKTVPITKKFCRNVEMMNFKFLCSVVWAVTKNVWKVWRSSAATSVFRARWQRSESTCRSTCPKPAPPSRTCSSSASTKSIPEASRSKYEAFLWFHVSPLYVTVGC